MRVISRPAAGDMIRRLLLAWLLTGAIQYTCLPAPERVLSGFSALTGQSFPLLLVGTAASFALLTLAGLLWRTARWERAALLLCFGWQLVLGLCASWSVPLLCAGLVVLALLLVLVVGYALFNQLRGPRTALRRWQQNIQSKYGSNALHLHTDFYDLTLAQTLQENGEVLDAGYSTITELRETEHLFLLHCGRQQWYFVNKAGFTKGTPDEFRAFISERIGG